MAYLKHTAAEVDAAIYSVERGSVVTENTDRVITPDGIKPVSGGAVYAALQGRQAQLTVTVNDNGNIVIGNLDGGAKEFMSATPSGDPMHYAYVAVGATWNASAGYWSLNTLTDITTEEMRKIYNVGFLHIPSTMLGYSQRSLIRTNLARIGRYSYTHQSVSLASLAFNNGTLEVVNLTGDSVAIGALESTATISVDSLASAFYGCGKLRVIFGRIDLTTSASVSNAFNGCSALEEVRMTTPVSVTFPSSPNLSKASIKYMVEKSNPTKNITITLHPTAYAMAKGDSDIQSALASKPNITIISA